MASSISKIIEFSDFSAEELTEILKLMIKKQGLLADEDFFGKIYDYLSDYQKNNSEYFGNAREIRKILSTLEQNQAIRLAERFSKGKVISEKKNINKGRYTCLKT